MTQDTAFGAAEADCVLKVHRAATGTDEFYRVEDPVINPDGTITGTHVPITEAEYEEATR